MRRTTRPKPTDQKYIEADENYVLIELTKLAKRYPEFDWLKEKCCFCRLPAVYLLCATFHNTKYTDYEPKNSAYRMAVFELRSMFETNFEFPVCEAHQFGEIRQ